MNLAKFAIEKRVVSALMTLLILLGGYLAYTALPRFEDPEFIVRQVQIITPYQGASAEEVANEVTDLIENAVQQLQGVKEVKSVSSMGMSEVSLEFTIAATKTRPQLNQKFAQLRAKISDIENRLPPGASTPNVFDDFGDVYALYFAITGDGYSLAEIKTYAKTLQKELVVVPGVSKVSITGDPQEVIYVEYNPSRLAQLGVSSGQVAQLLQGQSIVTPAGSVDAGNIRLAIRPSTTDKALESIKELVIVSAQSRRSIRLKDIATVTRGSVEPDSKLIFHDGKPAIGIGISNTIGGNVVDMGDAVNARIAKLEGQRPLGMELAAISDQSVAVRVSVNDFILNVLVALAIVVGTLLVFMGLRSGILMGGILLVTVAGTLIGMYLYGLDLHRISLGALIIALGMLVDNAIVVVDGTLVRVQKGESPKDASIAVVEQTKWPLLGGTIVGFLAFSAIGFSPDNTGEFAGSLFWTIAISLLFSWVIAVWLTPYFCTLVLKQQPAESATKKEHFVLVGYRKMLGVFLRFRWVTVALVLALFVSALMSASQVKQGFFPTSTRAQFVIDYNLPEGSSFHKTNADISQISDWVRELNGVISTNSVIGGGHLRFMLTYSAESSNPAYGQVLVDVDSFDQIDALLPTIQNHIDASYPDANAKVWKFVLGPGGGSAIQARFTGNDPVVLRKLSEQAKVIFSQEGAIGVKDNWREMVKVVRPKINEQNARRAGLSKSDIAKAIHEYFNGTRVGVYRESDELRPIVFRPTTEHRSDVKKIRTIEIFSQTYGRYIPISQVVDSFDIELENAKLQRYNRSLAIMAESDPAPGVDVNDVFLSIKPKVEAINLPDGYQLEWRGEYGNGKDAQKGLAITMPYGFGAMIIVVFLLFNAIKQPLIIYLTVPLAIIGVVYGLIALSTPMEFMAILGVLSLTGMLIKNAIVLIDQTDSEIADGKARMSAVVDAAVSRVRPVSLGVLTTVLGVVPLLSDPFFRSLAVVIICGLSFATILTLIIVPTLYAIFFGVKQDEV